MNKFVLDRNFQLFRSFTDLFIHLFTRYKEVIDGTGGAHNRGTVIHSIHRAAAQSTWHEERE